MARKSNKTAHVLNLLAGHDAKKETSEEILSDTSQEPVPSEVSEAVPESADKSAENTVPAQNISVIDKTEKDPVAELIQHKLADEFEKQLLESEPQAVVQAASPVAEPHVVTQTASPIPEPQVVTQVTAPVSEPQVIPQVAAPVPEPQVAPQVAAPVPEPQVAPQAAAPVPEPQVAPQVAAPIPEPQVAPQAAAPIPEPQVVTQAAAPIPEPQVTVPAEPEVPEEPDFIVLNVMERIVKEKIIYFMREFDVCTCDRCIADTVALTLNGLAPKYVVTSPMAADPLLSFYTNKFISEITVEATKACMVIKENPRH